MLRRSARLGEATAAAARRRHPHPHTHTQACWRAGGQNEEQTGYVEAGIAHSHAPHPCGDAACLAARRVSARQPPPLARSPARPHRTLLKGWWGKVVHRRASDGSGGLEIATSTHHTPHMSAVQSGRRCARCRSGKRRGRCRRGAPLRLCGGGLSLDCTLHAGAAVPTQFNQGGPHHISPTAAAAQGAT